MTDPWFSDPRRCRCVRCSMKLPSPGFMGQGDAAARQAAYVDERRRRREETGLVTREMIADWGEI